MVYRDDPVEEWPENDLVDDEESHSDLAPLFIGPEEEEDSSEIVAERRVSRINVRSYGLCLAMLLISLVVGVLLTKRTNNTPASQTRTPDTEDVSDTTTLLHDEKPHEILSPPPSPAPSSTSPLHPVASPMCDLHYNYTRLIHNISKYPSFRCGDNYPRQCNCNDPLHGSPTHKRWRARWDNAFQRNQLSLHPYVTTEEDATSQTSTAPDNRLLDVLLLGDSITEHWVGTDLGALQNGRIDPKYQGIRAVYQELFLSPDNKNDDNSNSNNNNVHGLALGIGGDRCSQLLYRVQNGELPPQLPVPVVWVTIGTNDLPDHCKEDAIVAGIVAVAQEIASRPLVVRIAWCMQQTFVMYDKKAGRISHTSLIVFFLYITASGGY